MEEVNLGILNQIRLMKNTGTALDVGCGYGVLGREITALGWQVVGIERSAEAVALAKERIASVVQADLQDYALVKREIGERRFDVLIFGDVLEHLYHPREVIENYRDLLKDNGKIIVSVPNAVAWPNRLNWLFGKVDYADSGVMDRTHIRFFSLKTAIRLVEASGIRVDAVDATPHLIRALLPLIKRLLTGNRVSAAKANRRWLVDSPGYRIYVRYVLPLELRITRLWKSMFAFQFIVVGTKDDRAAAALRDASDGDANAKGYGVP